MTPRGGIYGEFYGDGREVIGRFGRDYNGARQMTPLNGAKTHPLKKPALDALCALSSSHARPTQEFNPGVINRLLREGLIELIELPSPYKTRKGKILHAKLTPAGQSVVTKRD